MKLLKQKNIKQKAGYSLIEVLITSAILLLVFGGLFVAFNSSLKLVSESRIKTTALTLANDRMEFLRSLSYNEVGTIFGIPAGNIPQNRTVTFNGVTFNERVLVEYVDDPADGLEDEDENGIVADYKRVKIEYSWTVGDRNDSLYLVSNIVPASIETDAGGGTLRVRVFDADAELLEGISVRLVNEITSPKIDITRSTTDKGTALFTGVPDASGYEIFVSKAGYSSDQTYKATTTLPNPNKIPVAVLEGGTSTMDFRVDRLGNLELNFIKNKTINSFTEDFSSSLNFESLNDVVVSGGELILENTGGVFSNSGLAITKPISPATIEKWGVVKLNYPTISDTNVLVQVFSSTSTADLIPDSILPGNSTGFSKHFIDLQTLSVASYPSLVLGIKLETTNSSKTPKVEDFSVEFLEAAVPFSNVAFDLRGGKIIGSLADLTPVYKFSTSSTADSSGTKVFPGLEWDSYSVNIMNNTLREVCPAKYPIVLGPNQNQKTELWYENNTAESLRVAVLDSASNPIIGAKVKLSRGGFSETVESGWCGQAFFKNLIPASDYNIDISTADFGDRNLTGIIINGDVVETVTF